jgi:Domain of unknown function (DUF4397)
MNAIRRLVAHIAIAAIASCLSIAGVSIAGAAPAAAADVGYVRLAHLSPDTPEVDVYLSSVTGAIDERTFPGVGYGVVSEYQSLPTGTYAVSMRLAGADPSTQPVLTTQVEVATGQAYTVAGVDRNADLGLRVIEDDLSMPAAGKAKVRVVHASLQAPVLTMAVAGGDTIAADVAFASATDYREVDAGDWTLEIQPAGTEDVTTKQATLVEGNIYTCLVLDAEPDGLTWNLLLDAGRDGVIPAGGVDAGAGGLQRDDPVPGQSPVAVGLLAVALLALIAGASFLVVRRVRPQPT